MVLQHSVTAGWGQGTKDESMPGQQNACRSRSAHDTVYMENVIGLC